MELSNELPRDLDLQFKVFSKIWKLGATQCRTQFTYQKPILIKAATKCSKANITDFWWWRPVKGPCQISMRKRFAKGWNIGMCHGARCTCNTPAQFYFIFLQYPENLNLHCLWDALSKQKINIESSFRFLMCNEISRTLLIQVYLFSNDNDCVQITDSTEEIFIFHIISRFHKGELA